MLRSSRLLALGATATVAAVGLASASAGTSPLASAISAYRATHAVAARPAAATATALVTPKATCGKGSLPEGKTQGRVPMADFSNGRAAKGYTCNAVEVSHSGTTGGFKTFRYTDRTGRVCAFYDGTLLYPTAAVHGEPGGTVVLDMSDPARPA